MTITPRTFTLAMCNLEVLAHTPFEGDIEWMAVFSKALTVAEMLTVQVGFSRDNPKMITNVGSCAMLHRLNATGTLSDFSGYSNNCAITGATTTTGQTIFAPTQWGNSIDATDKNDYLLTNSHATVSYSTSATSVILSRATDPRSHLHRSSGHNCLGQWRIQHSGCRLGSRQGFAPVSLLAGSKTVTFVNGVRNRPLTNSPEGTFLTSALFNAAATEVIPATPTNNIVFLADSIFDDFLASPVGNNGVISKFREDVRATHNVMLEGYGGASLRDYALDEVLSLPRSQRWPDTTLRFS